LDTVLEFQDDEDVLNEEGEVAWDDEAGRRGEGDDEEPEQPSADEDDDDEKEEEECEDNDLMADAEEVAGSSAQAQGEENQEPLSAEDAAALATHGSRMDALKQAYDAVQSLNDPSLCMTLMRAMHTAERSERFRVSTAPAVAGAMIRQRDLQDQRLRQQKRELQERMDGERASKRLKVEVKETEAKLAKAKKQLKDAQGMTESFEAVKSFTPEMLGFGKRGGGTAQNRKARMEVLQRVATHGVLSAQQKNDWQWFADEWDKAMITTHDATWGDVFAQAMQQLTVEIESGKTDAVSVFMNRETIRVLSNVEVLRI